MGRPKRKDLPTVDRQRTADLSRIEALLCANECNGSPVVPAPSSEVNVDFKDDNHDSIRIVTVVISQDMSCIHRVCGCSILRLNIIVSKF